MKNLQNIPLKAKIQIIIIFCAGTISVTAFTSIFFISKAYQQVLYQAISTSLAYSATEITKALNQTDSIADLILSNSTIQTQLAHSGDHLTKSEAEAINQKIYVELCEYVYHLNNSNISLISILYGQQTVTTSAYTFSQIPDSIKEHLVQRGRAEEGKTIWVTDYSETYGIFLVKELREISGLSLKNLGVLIINVNLEDLITSTTTFNTSAHPPSYIISNDDKTMYHRLGLSQTDAHSIEAHLTESYGVLPLESGMQFVVRQTIPQFHWKYICSVSYDSIASVITLTSKLIILAIISSVVVVLLISSKMVASITKHFNRLIAKMKQFGEGHYDLEEEYDYHSRTDEIGQLHASFDVMALKTDALIKANYINELLKKEAQLKALESQMDPHFLYNALDSINWRAKALNAPDIFQITTALGRLLRISLDKNIKNFTIRQEMDLVENYMTIQKLRFQRRLEYQLTVPEEFLNCQIPKFTVQPLLENAIRYGLEEMSETCFISIQAFSCSDNLMIEVKNSGSSFEEGLLEKLESQAIRPHGFGIGLLNIHKRLVLTYGDSYGLRLYNIGNEETDEEFAVAQIVLPLL